ncbi:MAG: response regulator transcription factor [Desulfobacteraceae bacterium]|jgi:DNA-binding NarL/FixJ family response regulator
MTKDRIDVILADDQIITRSGLKALFERHEKISVAAEASNGREAVRLALELKPRIVIMEVSLPELNGVDATRQITAGNPDIKVIALTMLSHRQHVSGMLKAGAKGYLLKSCTFDELRHAVLTVADDKTYLCPSIADTLVKDYIHSSSSKPSILSPSQELTGREREVLQLIAEGLSTREIGQRLFVSESTVNTHRRQIMEKLNIHNIAKLTKFAIQEGLTFLEG